MYGGQPVKAGGIIIRQLGTQVPACAHGIPIAFPCVQKVRCGDIEQCELVRAETESPLPCLAIRVSQPCPDFDVLFELHTMRRGRMQLKDPYRP